MTDPTNTAALRSADQLADDRGYGLLTLTAQQAVLPRKLEEGVYALLGADGAVTIRETDGYAQKRRHDWERAHDDRPEFVHRNVTVLDVPSFLDYLGRYSGDDLTAGDYLVNLGALEVWADVDGRKITGILDGLNGLRKHTAMLSLKTSREWDEWAAVDGKLLDQQEFAQFIEDHISTIAEPDGARLIDICETLTGTTNAQWKSQHLGANGQRRFVWEEQVEAKAGQKGNLDVPTELALVLRPFQGSEAVAIAARFRYRMQEGHLRLGVKLAEPQRRLEQAFDLICDEVQAGVPVRVNHGRP
jgi:hypothetical protein